MPLTTLVANSTARAADLNNNFAVCMLTDTSRTVSATHTYTATQNFSANIGVGATASATVGVLVQNTNSVAHTGLYATPEITATAASLYCAEFRARTAASAITITDVQAVRIDAPSKGSGSTITNQYGIYIESLVEATTNYAIWTNTGLVRLGCIDTTGFTIGTAFTSFGAGYTTASLSGTSGAGWRFGVTSGVNGYLYHDATGTTLATSSALPIVFSPNNAEVGRWVSGGGLKFASGVGTLADGMLWWDGLNLKFRQGGATKTITWA